MTSIVKAVALAACVATAGMPAGCATRNSAATASTAAAGVGAPAGQALDPWEPWNRRVFAFNEGLDRTVLKPVATGYAQVVPQVVRRGIDNVFGNVADAWSAFNNVLQGKPEPAFVDLVRVVTNTTLGIFGLLDIATEAGLERHGEDFGQTLGVWGFGAGAYVVWPLLGPSTVRDSAALPLDLSASPTLALDGNAAKAGVSLLQIVNTRARLLGASNVIDDIALDKYTFTRDAYLQRRRSLVHDGDAPATDDAASNPSAAPVR